MILKYKVDETTHGKQVKWVLKNKLNISERLLKRLKYDNKILVNESPVFTNYIVSKDDTITANVNFEEDSEGIIPENIALDIIYEDDYLIAINKMPNTVVHPTSNHLTGTIANGLVKHFNDNGISLKVRPVSRLDRDTSGVIVFAKNQFVQEQLIQSMQRNEYKKLYLGVVWGNIKDETGTINMPIDRAPGSIMLRQVSPTGVIAITHYKVLKRFKDATLMEFDLETGRTHQIRVHCSAIGHPLIGDTLYSDIETDLISRQALHSYHTEFIHPVTQTLLKLEAKLPDDIMLLQDRL